MNNNDLVIFSLPKIQIHHKIGLQKICSNYEYLQNTQRKHSYLMAAANYPSTLSCPVLIIFLLFVYSTVMKPQWDQGPPTTAGTSTQGRDLQRPQPGRVEQRAAPKSSSCCRRWSALSQALSPSHHPPVASEQARCFLNTGWKMIDVLPWEVRVDARTRGAACSAAALPAVLVWLP